MDRKESVESLVSLFVLHGKDEECGISRREEEAKGKKGEKEGRKEDGYSRLS